MKQMSKIIFCDRCGSEIKDPSTCKMYRSHGPFYDTIYICKDCDNFNKKKKEDPEEDDRK
jgi:ribosome-binding protein aMBF1 (putative translation factor)